MREMSKRRLQVVDQQHSEEMMPERKGRPKVSVYFPSQARLKECMDIIEEDFEAGRITTNELSKVFYFLFCRYERERKPKQTQETQT